MILDFPISINSALDRLRYAYAAFMKQYPGHEAVGYIYENHQIQYAGVFLFGRWYSGGSGETHEERQLGVALDECRKLINMDVTNCRKIICYSRGDGSHPEIQFFSDADEIEHVLLPHLHD